MYPVAIAGNDAAARATILALTKAGFSDLTWAPGDGAPEVPALTLSANLSRVVIALGREQALLDAAFEPGREQIRLARSGYLLSELPLGQFLRERYGAPHLNIDTADLAEVLAPGPVPTTNEADLTELARHHRLVATGRAVQSGSAGSHMLSHAALPLAEVGPNTQANITWLGNGSIAWEFSTRRQRHYFFLFPCAKALSPPDWHPTLHDAVARQVPLTRLDPFDNPVRKHWQEGSMTYFGAGCLNGNPLNRASYALGLEDAWVLSRMLENYEEAVGDGLREYERYRRARSRRVATRLTQSAERQLQPSGPRRLRHHLGVALSTRFLPEIAMRQIDWLYGYDCIRGFR